MLTLTTLLHRLAPSRRRASPTASVRGLCRRTYAELPSRLFDDVGIAPFDIAAATTRRREGG